jgi:hypothetical protein
MLTLFKIVDDRFIVESSKSYHTLFALGLLQNSGKDFVAWVEPYSFATGSILGTTVSTLVYDRSKDRCYRQGSRLGGRESRGVG